MYSIYEDTGYRVWHKGMYSMVEAHSIARQLSKKNPHLYKVYSPGNVCVTSYRHGKAI